MATRRRGRRSGGPGLAKWHMSAGGTGAAPGKHGYSLLVGGAVSDGGRQYNISPYTSEHGRHRGYFLSVFPGEQHGHAGIRADGQEVSINVHDSSFRSPQAAARAAAIHMARRGR